MVVLRIHAESVDADKVVRKPGSELEMSCRYVLMVFLSTVVTLSCGAAEATEADASRIQAEAAQRRASINLTDEPGRTSAGRETTPSFSRQPKLVVERYSNGRVKTARTVATTDSGKAVLDGEWTRYSVDGRLQAKGYYRNGKRDGVWNRWYFGKERPFIEKKPYSLYSGPFVSQALFRNGKLHGYWIIFDERQRKISQFVFKDGQRSGASTWWYPNGEKQQEIYYSQGIPHGLRIRFDSDGKITQRDRFDRGRLIRTEQTSYPSGAKKSAGTMLEPQLQRKTSDDWWNAEAAKYVAVGSKQKHGTWKKWHDNGQLAVAGDYRNGRPEGPFVWHATDGKRVTEGSFTAGRRDGRWRWWHANGKLKTEGVFRAGQAIGMWQWWNVDGDRARSKDLGGSRPLAAASADRRKLNP